MNRSETNRFIEDVLCKLWPDWTPTDEESIVWYGVMSCFSYEVARTAAQQCFADTTGNYKRPKPSGIITKANLIALDNSTGPKVRESIQTNVFIECMEPPERNPNLNGRKGVYAETEALQCDPDHLMRCAETMRKEFERLYGGHWITVKTNLPVDDGLRGKEARQKAFRNILQGEDTPGKRWLTKYLEGKQSESLANNAGKMLMTA